MYQIKTTNNIYIRKHANLLYHLPSILIYITCSL